MVDHEPGPIFTDAASVEALHEGVLGMLAGHMQTADDAAERGRIDAMSLDSFRDWCRTALPHLREMFDRIDDDTLRSIRDAIEQPTTEDD